MNDDNLSRKGLFIDNDQAFVCQHDPVAVRVVSVVTVRPGGTRPPEDRVLRQSFQKPRGLASRCAARLGHPRPPAQPTVFLRRRGPSQARSLAQAEAVSGSSGRAYRSSELSRCDIFGGSQSLASALGPW